MSKQVDLFATLMQALSRHLRPAPYPYGLLTLRLLGKLGGKNRQFLREPLLVFHPSSTNDQYSRLLSRTLSVQSSWDSSEHDGGGLLPSVDVPLPLDRCIEILKLIAVGGSSSDLNKQTGADQVDRVTEHPAVVISWENRAKLWTDRLEYVDFSTYSKDVMERTKDSQAQACLAVLQKAVTKLSECSTQDDVLENRDTLSMDTEFRLVYLGLLHACLLDATKGDACATLQALMFRPGRDAAFCASFVQFLAEPSEAVTAVGRDLLHFIEQRNREESTALQDMILSALCGNCVSQNWGNRTGLRKVVCYLLKMMGRERCRSHEVELINTALVCVKSVPREVSSASVEALRFFVKVCVTLYDAPCRQDASSTPPIVWDVLEITDEIRQTNSENKKNSDTDTGSKPTATPQAPEDKRERKDEGEASVARSSDGAAEEGNASDDGPNEHGSASESSPGRKLGTAAQPSEAVFRLLAIEMASSEQTVRCAFLMIMLLVGILNIET